jgi:diketogulonate reductase-like aldo/keto reductase
MRRALAAATEPLVANQCEYHPRLDQGAVIGACREAGMAFVSYSPVAKGEVFDAVAEIAARHGRTPAQVVLRWHVQQEGVVAVPKSETPSRIAENLAVFDFALTPEEMAAIHALAHPGGRMISPEFAPDWD